ncbi:MAG: hypothetical protein AB7G47_10250 [Mycolicibacterium sp.]|uniref:hypothetical protein n=1 Tax=Mycolicibacterium sp. TaxID=2320850 RepID=UPI003D10C073
MTELGTGQKGPPQIKTISSLNRYNDEFPQAPMPSNMRELEAMRRFDAGGIGLEDDITGSGGLHTIEFLPGGAPLSAEEDRFGVVIATLWGRAPVRILAEDVSLWQAWLALTRRWPTKLSGAAEALIDLRRYPGAT